MIGRKPTSSRLRQRLTLQKEIQTADGAGGYTRSWQDVADLWAEIIPLRGKEEFFAARLQSEVTHRILIRYRHGIDAGQRLTFESRAFHIRHIADAGTGSDILELLVEEGVA